MSAIGTNARPGPTAATKKRLTRDRESPAVTQNRQQRYTESSANPDPHW